MSLVTTTGKVGSEASYLLGGVLMLANRVRERSPPDSTRPTRLARQSGNGARLAAVVVTRPDSH